MLKNVEVVSCLTGQRDIFAVGFRRKEELERLSAVKLEADNIVAKGKELITSSEAQARLTREAADKYDKTVRGVADRDSRDKLEAADCAVSSANAEVRRLNSLSKQSAEHLRDLQARIEAAKSAAAKILGS